MATAINIGLGLAVLVLGFGVNSASTAVAALWCGALGFTAGLYGLLIVRPGGAAETAPVQKVVYSSHVAYHRIFDHRAGVFADYDARTFEHLRRAWGCHQAYGDLSQVKMKMGYKQWGRVRAELIKLGYVARKDGGGTAGSVLTSEGVRYCRQLFG